VAPEISSGPNPDAGETAHPFHLAPGDLHLERAGDCILAHRARLVAAGPGSNLHHPAVPKAILLVEGTAAHGGCYETAAQKTGRRRSSSPKESLHHFDQHARTDLFGFTQPCRMLAIGLRT